MFSPENVACLIFICIFFFFHLLTMQAVTRELKEQSTLLQAARAELRRLKQASGLSCVNNAPANSSLLSGSTPPSSIGGFPVAEKKQSNNNNNNNNNSANNHHTNGDIQQGQTKKRQMEELVRKVSDLFSSALRIHSKYKNRISSQIIKFERSLIFR